MGPALTLLIAALLAAPAGQAAAGAPGVRRCAAAHRQGRTPPKPAARKLSAFEQAKADLKSLMRDPQRRRYHHNWERAIKALQASAKGKDAPVATLEAARARYALYRWSADEADRVEALKLAALATRLGAKEAGAFAAAVRREAGDDRPAAKAAPAIAKGKSTAPAPAAAPAEEAPPDPELESVLADLKASAPSAPGGEPAAPAPKRPDPAPAEGTAGQPSDEAGELRPLRRVVVDAGHGGYDPGAIGPTRVKEKDVTLAIARKLAAKLKAAGFEVVMTRSDDVFVALEDRPAIANAQRGDLFVSIHANANPRRALAGTETWILNVADDRYAKRLAARENGANLEEGGEGTEAQRILTDLDAKASTEASRRLAQGVQRELTGAVRARFGEDKDLGVKSALFYVLLGARMPAVLVETAFISNAIEERRLATPSYQDVVAGSICRAIEQFAKRDPRVARADGAAGE